MKVSDYNYDLPDSLVALHPPKTRGSSRLLVLDKKTGQVQHSKYAKLGDYLSEGDLVILNDTKVIKARLIAKNSKDQIRELLLLEDHHNTDFTKRRSIYRGKIRDGEILNIGNHEIRITKVLPGGIAEISSLTNLIDLAEREGSVPLPPYMHRDADEEDNERYQTVFAKSPGSVAAPTASLNFTKQLQQQLVASDVRISYITLHVGLGTFLPIRTDDIKAHKMHSEYFEIPAETTEAIRQTKASGRKVIAVGTTVTRTLEFCSDDIMNSSKKLTGEANIFIYPGYKFKCVDAMLTNFHAPRSTVLMMAAAFTGWENLLNSYEIAKQEKYSFLSYGDSMLIH